MLLKTVHPQSLLCGLFHFHIGAWALSSSSSERGKAQMSHKRRTLVFDRVNPKRAASSHRKAYSNVSFAPSRRRSVCERSSQTETALIEPASLYPSCFWLSYIRAPTFSRGRTWALVRSFSVSHQRYQKQKTARKMRLWNVTEQILAEADHVSLRAGVNETDADA